RLLPGGGWRASWRRPWPRGAVGRSRSTAPKGHWALRATKAWAGCRPASSRTWSPPWLVGCAWRELQLSPRFRRQHLAKCSGGAPVQRAERAAALAYRPPALMVGCARRAAPGAVGRRVGGARQPVVDLRLLGMRAFLDLGHQATDAHCGVAAACALEIAPRLAP